MAAPSRKTISSEATVVGTIFAGTFPEFALDELRGSNVRSLMRKMERKSEISSEGEASIAKEFTRAGREMGIEPSGFSKSLRTSGEEAA